MGEPQFSHSAVEDYLGWLQLLTVMNEATENI
jgi:hypothetical protein